MGIKVCWVALTLAASEVVVGTMELQSSEGATGWRVCLYVAHVEGLSSLPHKHPYRATVKVLAFQPLASPRVSNQKESKMEAKMSFLTWKS